MILNFKTEKKLKIFVKLIQHFFEYTENFKPFFGSFKNNYDEQYWHE